MAVQALEGLHEVGILQEPHVQDDIGIRRQAAAVPERLDVQDDPAGRRRRQKGPLDGVLELVHVQERRIDHRVGHILEGGHFPPLLLDPFHDGPFHRQGMHAPGLAEPVQEGLVAGIEKQHFDPVSLFLQ